MKVAYIAGPYRDPRGAYYVGLNIAVARAYAIEFWRRGYAVICPHLNTAFMDGAADDSVWLAGDLEFVRRSDVIVMLPGWENSVGATREEALARELGKELIYQMGVIGAPPEEWGRSPVEREISRILRSMS